MELAIDTAGDIAGVGLSVEGVTHAELRWSCPRRQGAELLPAVDDLIWRIGAAKSDLTALFVCLGPGSYMGVRVGVATAKALARALDLPLAGVGRLALDAWPHRGYAGPVVAVHKAGRSEWAWAAYTGDDHEESVAPRLDALDALAAALPRGALVCGEPDATLRASLPQARFVGGESVARRPAALCELGWRRLQRHGPDEPIALVPMYLREPSIGPQRTGGG